MKKIILIIAFLSLFGCVKASTEDITSADFSVDNEGNLLFRNEIIGNFKGEAGNDGVDGINGIDGINGKNGLSGIDGVDGTNGLNGTNGSDGKTPFIGSNGNWWIGSIDTGVQASSDFVFNHGDTVDIYPNSDFSWVVENTEDVIYIDSISAIVDFVNFDSFSQDPTRYGYINDDQYTMRYFSPYKIGFMVSGHVETDFVNPYYIRIYLMNGSEEFMIYGTVYNGNEFYIEDYATLYDPSKTLYFAYAEVMQEIYH